MSNHAIGNIMGDFLYYISQFYQSKEITENAFKKITKEAKEWVTSYDGNINEMLNKFGPNNFCFICLNEYGKNEYSKVKHIDAFIDDFMDITVEKNIPNWWSIYNKYKKIFENDKTPCHLPLICEKCFKKYYLDDFINISNLSKEKIMEIFKNVDNYSYCEI